MTTPSEKEPYLRMAAGGCSVAFFIIFFLAGVAWPASFILGGGLRDSEPLMAATLIGLPALLAAGFLGVLTLALPTGKSARKISAATVLNTTLLLSSIAAAAVLFHTCSRNTAVKKPAPERKISP
jgi:hypothetical protein